MLFSLLLSVGPSYRLNRRYVWPEGVGRSGASRLGPFAALALVGSLVTAVSAHLADALGQHLTTNRGLLTLAVNTAALATTIAIWAARFWLFDRFLFATSADH